jgi:hypothetical protein
LSALHRAHENTERLAFAGGHHPRLFRSTTDVLATDEPRAERRRTKKRPALAKPRACSRLRGFYYFSANARQELVMVKEQKRGNREAKKPKAVKTAAAVNPPLLAAGKLTPIKPPKKG